MTALAEAGLHGQYSNVVLRRNLRFKSRASACVLVLLSFWTTADGAAPSIAQDTRPLGSAQERFSSDDLKEDLRIARAALEEGDPGLYRFTAKRPLDVSFASAEASLGREMTELQFFPVLAQAIAKAGDGHAQLRISEGLAQQLATARLTLPLNVRIIKGRPYVISDLSGLNAADPGAEILAVNDVPAANVVRLIESTLSEDSARPSSRDRDASGLGFTQGLVRTVSLIAPYAVRFSVQGKQLLRTYDGITESEFVERVKASRTPGAATGLTFHENGVAIIRIAHWDSDDTTDGISAQLPRWFQQLSDRKATSLIIDVRNNGGGEETIATELLSYLVAAPFRYYDCAVLNGITFGFLRYVQDDGTPYAKLLPQYARPAGAHCRHLGSYELTNRPNLGLQQPRSPHFTGQIYLLVNAGSFSTSAEFAATLRTFTRAVIVGQETSGNYYGDNSGITIPIVLPHSRLVLQVPTVAYYLAVRKDLPPRSGVIPDVAVALSVREILLDRDAELAATMNLVKSRL
jgi:hypothetical protein